MNKIKKHLGINIETKETDVSVQIEPSVLRSHFIKSLCQLIGRIVLSPESYPVWDVMGHDNSKSEGNLGCCTKEGDYASN